MNENNSDLNKDLIWKVTKCIIMKCHFFGHKYVISYKHLCVTCISHCTLSKKK